MGIEVEMWEPEPQRVFDPDALPITFILTDVPRSKLFDDLVRKYMFPGAYSVPSREPTDSPKGEATQYITGQPGDTVGVTLGPNPTRMFTIPQGKKATKIKYTYEIELEDLPKCDQCHGSGQVTLFTTIEQCGGCNGSGYKRG